MAVAGPPSEAQLTCLGRLAQAAQVWLEEMQSQVKLPVWEEALKKRRVDYNGSEAQARESLTWEQIQPGVPRPGLAECRKDSPYSTLKT